ncbi:MAG: tRNA adenosine(34) deaminase TadA [Planctomycetota bacterium]
MTDATDEQRMRLALRQAEAAARAGDVPVGCVVFSADRLVARERNRRASLQDPTAHAEILALRSAARKLGTWHMEEATVYVTVEPCCMCAGALVNARVGGLVYGAEQPKSGACGSLYDIPRDERLNHRLPVRGGVLAQEARRLLQEFFRRRRESD